MSLIKFQKDLELDLQKKIKLKVNNNRSTMLSVQWKSDCTEVSIHRFFEEAPQNIMDSLACYIKQEGRQAMSPRVRSFIDDNLRKLDCSSHLEKMYLNVQGRVHNLKVLFDRVNQEYFANALQLHLTWFSQKSSKNRSRLLFGLYYEPLKLIKINDFLDRKHVPSYLVEYVIYHETLHHLYPAYYNDSGKRSIHHKEFKEKERAFREYKRAQAWIEDNRDALFTY